MRGISKDQRGPHHINFVFDGVCSPTKRSPISNYKKLELTEYRFVSPEEGMTLLSEGWGTRMTESLKALAKHTIVYLENGKEMGELNQ